MVLAVMQISIYYPSRESAPAGFTLIELLTVIAIIGILTAIFIPTMGAVREKAQRSVDSNNLREIAKAAMIYAGDNNERLPDPEAIATAASLTGGTHVYLWSGILAKNNLVADPALYFAKNDPLFAGVYPSAILDTTDATHKTLDTGFAAALLSWEFVGGLRMGDPATTPVAYTRGLQADGHWAADTGVYKDSGGFVAYLGGNVVFYKDTEGVFKSNNTGVKTSDIREAIPQSATASARIYGTPPPEGTILGSAAGTIAVKGS
jgi:prepilin-type N-terminal cleavage/methylation domain-containing protein